MRKITKQQKPYALQKWEADNTSTPDNLCYEGGGFPTADVKMALLREQKHLCAYTMLRISDSGCHIEHMKPRTACKNTDRDLISQGEAPRREDIAWSNLVACYPDSMSPRAAFGAHYKDDWWNPDCFVKPTDDTCEARFRFGMDGKIKAASDTDLPALETIERLNLNEATLVEKRQSAFKGAGIHPRSKWKKRPKAARQLAQEIGRNTDEKAREFSVALAQVAEIYAKTTETISRQKRASTGKARP